MSTALVILFILFALAVGVWVTIVNARDWKKLPPDQQELPWMPFVRLPEPARTVRQRMMNRMFISGLGLTMVGWGMAFLGSHL
jgi:hypothetical protein